GWWRCSLGQWRRWRVWCHRSERRGSIRLRLCASVDVRRGSDQKRRNRLCCNPARPIPAALSPRTPAKLPSPLMPTLDPDPMACERSLLTELRQHESQRETRDLDHAVKWTVKLEDQEDCRRDRHGSDEEHGDDGAVAWRIETKARERHGQPEDHDHQKW